MQKKPSSRRGAPWTKHEIDQLRLLISQNTPTRVIALKLDRSESSIYGKASQAGLSLRPNNQSPYG